MKKRSLLDAEFVMGGVVLALASWKNAAARTNHSPYYGILLEMHSIMDFR
jgi:hypothetical protein